MNSLCFCFCRFLKQKSRLPEGVFFEFLLWASPANYAYESLVVNEMNGLTGLSLTSKIGKEEVQSPELTGSEITSCFGFMDRVDYDMRMLGFMVVFYFTAVWIAMEILGRERR